jgi:hypothetical protein
MKQSIFFSAIVASFLLLSCQKDIIQKQKEPNNNNVVTAAKGHMAKDRPFKGSYTTSSEILQPAPFLRTRITGTGHVSHLGYSTFVALSTLEFTSQPPFQLYGTATFTAANGDAFYTSFTGTSTPTGQGTLDIVMNHIIAGGTGRFENASGSFVGYTTAFPGHSDGYIEHEGTIRY